MKILPLLIALFATQAYSQLDELSMLGIIPENINQATQGSLNESNNRILRDTDDQSDTSLDEENFQDVTYGYTGGETFNNPPVSKFPREPLQRFGYDYFSEPSSSFVPLMDIPVPPDYLIGPNDTVKIILFGATNQKYELAVNRDGEIFIPELGPLSIAGLSFQDAKYLINTTVTNKFIGTEVSTTLGNLRTIDIFILGAAKNPGMYSISALSSMTNAIFESGGIDLSGSLRDIKLKRNGKIIAQLDFYELLINGNTSSNIRLMQGDAILIEPVGKTAALRGEVNRPGIYEILESENLEDLLNFAGKLKPKANKSSAEILRINQKRNSFDLSKIDLVNQSKYSLADGDIISIYPINDKIQNAVLVTGHTIQPGFYSWQEGMKITDLFSGPDDLLEMTDMSYVLIKRKDPKTQRIAFHQADLELAFSGNKNYQDIELMDQDEILLLPSLLNLESISTKLVLTDNQEVENTEQLTQETELNPLTLLRKALSEKKDDDNLLNNQAQMAQNQNMPLEPNLESQEENYYEYSIYNYCILTEEIAREALDELEFNIDSENYQVLTKYCREQLMKPMLDELRRASDQDRLTLISIFGNVHFPGFYPFTENMKLSDVIKAAGGSRNGNYNSEIETIRLDRDGKRFSSRNNISSREDAESISLKKMDTVTLKQLSTEVRVVEIKGEVYFPGEYPIGQNETLASLVKRAGGLTELADPSASFFQREQLKIAESERFNQAQEELRRKIILSSQQGNLGQDAMDMQLINQLISLTQADNNEESLGRLILNLGAIIEGTNKDILLEDGDVLSIPRSKGSISVIGEVFVSNAHLYDQRLTISDYIKLSGGFTSFADENSIYLIRADGSILPSSEINSGFFRSSSSRLSQGDTIVVPLRVQTFSQLKATTEITQIIYQMALAAAAVNSF